MAVLSIQSHVVYGYAGNSAAVFPLQRLGNEVWAVNTVEFSNHTGYGSWRGQALDAGLIQDLVTGLKERGVLNRCNAVLSGYLGSAAVSKAILEAVKMVKKENPGALYCCDPVMGDVGRGIYVKPDIPDIIKNELIPHADIICPNQFELEVLTGIEVNGIDTAIEAIFAIHKAGPSIVLVTSFKEGEKAGSPTLSMLASNKNELYRITTPELPLGGGVAGTGDLTTSAFLSWYLQTKDMEKALNLCTSGVYGIIDKSCNIAYNKRESPIELKIIEAQEELCSPTYTYKAVKLND
ncbi:MAG: pyridoxal kinase PdxY [Treponema sp.]|jgi:pyridoxine kinase|nr:pyridoxal kinase PdxY [Treponema sp.]